MAITLEIDPATLIPTVAISDKPDQTVNDKAIWEMDEQILLDHPELSSNLRAGRFQYLGAVERGGRGKSAGQRVLLYTKPDPEALRGGERPIEPDDPDVAGPEVIAPAPDQAVVIESAGMGPDGAGLPDGVRGTPVDDAHAGPPITSADVLRRVAQQEQAAAEQAQRERVERATAAIADAPRDPQREGIMLTDEEQEKLVEQARRDPTIQPGPPHTVPTAGTSAQVKPPDRVDPATGESLPPDAPSIGETQVEVDEQGNPVRDDDANDEARRARETEEARRAARDQQTATQQAQRQRTEKK